MEGLHEKNFKSLKKEIEEDTRKRKDHPCSRVGRINIVKTAIILKAIYRFNEMTIKILAKFFKDLERTILNFHMKKKKKQDSHNNPV